MRLEEQAGLAPLTSFGLGGPARYLAGPRTYEELRDALELARNEGLPVKVLGGGTNLLVADEGVRALVLRLGRGEFGELSIEGGRLKAGAAVPTARIINAASRAGLAGLECLAGLPGTIGGAVATNAGGPSGRTRPHVRRVDAMDLEGNSEGLPSPAFREEPGAASPRAFARRRPHRSVGPTVVRREGRSGTLAGPTAPRRRVKAPNAAPIFVQVELELEEDDPSEVRRRTREWLDRRLATQPTTARSAGCVFRNPPGISAGELIDELGLKGKAVGGASVSEVHANFIVAREGATAADVMGLIEVVRARAREERGVELELEIEIWRPEP